MICTRVARVKRFSRRSRLAMRIETAITVGEGKLTVIGESF